MNSKNSAGKTQIVVIAAVAVVAVTGIAVYSFTGSAPEKAPAADDAPVASTQTQGDKGDDGSSKSLWDLVKQDKANQANNVTSASDDDAQEVPEGPFDEEAVAQALQQVRVDSNGDVILDDEALQALNTQLRYGEVELTSQQLSELQEQIRQGMPGKAGEQTAQVVGDYYRYLQAESEYNEVHGGNKAVEGDIDAAQERYRELQQLRNQHLGQDVAQELFQTSDASAKYMFEAHRIQNDSSLSQEEKMEKVQELQDKARHASIDVPNWSQRYERFKSQKQQIVDASMSREDKRAQVRSLMEQEFSPDELKEVEHLNLDNL